VCDGSGDFGEQFRQSARRKVGDIGIGLGPNPFDRVQLRCVDGEVVDMDPRMSSQEFLHDPALMNRMVIPDQNDPAAHDLQHLLQKSDDLFAAQIASVHAAGQPDPAARWADQQCPQRVPAPLVWQAGADGRRVPPRRPTLFFFGLFASWRRRRTLRSFQPSMSATSRTLFPCASNFSPRFRLVANGSSVPKGLMPPCSYQCRSLGLCFLKIQ